MTRAFSGVRSGKPPSASRSLSRKAFCRACTSAGVLSLATSARRASKCFWHSASRYVRSMADGCDLAALAMTVRSSDARTRCAGRGRRAVRLRRTVFEAMVVFLHRGPQASSVDRCPSYTEKWRVARHSSVKDTKREKFADGPDVVGPCRGHRGRALQPLLALLLPDAQAAMSLAEVIDTTHQIPPCLQH